MSNTLMDSQEVSEITPELMVIMDDLGLPAQSLAIGLSKGYEAQVIDESRPVTSGNVIWAQKRHIDSFREYLDREVAGAFEDGARSVPKAEPSPPPSPKNPGAIYTEDDLRAAVAVAVEEAVVTALQKAKGNPKGKESYEGRLAGKDWAEIGPNSLNNAKAYAKKNGLPWPVKIG